MTNFNLNVNVKIEAPELCAALTLLAGPRPAAMAPAARPAAPGPVPAPGSAAVPTAPLAIQPAAPSPVPVSAPAAVPVVPSQAAPVAPAAPVPSVAAPTAAPRQYAFTDLQLAATALCDAGKRDAVLALLEQFQVKALSGLSPEQYGAFATALRGLGAKI